MSYTLKFAINTVKNRTQRREGKNPRINLLVRARELIFGAPGKYVSSPNGGREVN